MVDRESDYYWRYDCSLLGTNGRKDAIPIVMITCGDSYYTAHGHDDTQYYVPSHRDGVKVVVNPDGTTTVAVSLELIKQIISAKLAKSQETVDAASSIKRDISNGLTAEMLREKYPDVPLDWFVNPELAMYYPSMGIQLNKRDLAGIQELINKQNKS